MPDIAAVLKEEIARIARREVRSETEKLKKASGVYRGQIADLKRQVTALQKALAAALKGSSPPEPKGESAATYRWSPARLHKHRVRLDLSAELFGKLFGVSGQTIYNWEGGTRPSKDQLAKIAQLRQLTKQHAHAIVGKTGSP